METSKGKLVYRMPKEIYKDNANKKIDLIIVFITLIVMVYPILWTIINGMWYPAFLFICGVSFAGSSIWSKLGNKPLTRFEIYENGFVPAVKPVKYYLRREEFFVPFSEISDVEFLRGGVVCILHHKMSNDEITVSIDDHDIYGYVKFLKAMKWKYPAFPLPDINIIIEGFYANIRANLAHWWSTGWSNYYAKQLADRTPLSEDKGFEMYKKRLEMNPDVGPVPLSGSPRPGLPIHRNCGKWLDYISQYDRWYCYNCEEYDPRDEEYL